MLILLQRALTTPNPSWGDGTGISKDEYDPNALLLTPHGVTGLILDQLDSNSLEDS